MESHVEFSSGEMVVLVLDVEFLDEKKCKTFTIHKENERMKKKEAKQNHTETNNQQQQK